MNLEVSTGTAPPDWEDELRSAGGPLFHSQAWADYTLAHRHGATPLFVSLMAQGGTRAALALSFLARSSNRLIAPFSGEIWMDSYPVTMGGHNSGDNARALVLGLERWARRRGAVEMSVDSFAALRSELPLADLGFSLTHRLEFELALQQTDEALSAGMEYKRRKNLNKARRLGVQIVELDADTGVLALRRLQDASGERIVRRGGPRIGLAGDGGRDPVYELMRHGVGRLVGAVVDSEVVSAGLFTRFGPLVYHTLSGHGGKALETQAPTLLIWEMLRRYRDEGAERFNFGGCGADAVREDSPEHGVYVYKKAFGATGIELTSGTRVLRPLTHWAFTRIRALTS